MALVLDDAMAVAVAAQACVPVLHLPGELDWYDGFVGIVLHPSEVVVPRQWHDGTAWCTTATEVLAGEAIEGGPLMLSWQDVRLGGRDGRLEADQDRPTTSSSTSSSMSSTCATARSTACRPCRRDAARALADGHGRGLRAPCRRGRCRPADRLDPYAAQGPEEFFPVAAEAFFVAPHGLALEFPEVYALMRDFFHQDPRLHAR